MNTIARFAGAVIMACVFSSLPALALGQTQQMDQTATSPPSGLVTTPPGTTPTPMLSPANGIYAPSPAVSPPVSISPSPTPAYQTTTTTMTIRHSGAAWLGWFGLLGLLGLFGLAGRSRGSS